jgi:diadenosine tetraphosphate (Ap4A) HIT family hydrolase
MYAHYLWATSRMRWVKKPGKKPKGCLFCGIARGDPDIPSKVIHKDRSMMVIMNIFPYNVGHLEVVPVRHVEELGDLSGDEFERFFRMIEKSVVLLRKALNPRGFNIGFNIGQFSGASIRHLHAQIVPRYERDSGFMEVTAETKVMPESIDQTRKKLMKFAGMLKK